MLFLFAAGNVILKAKAEVSGFDGKIKGVVWFYQYDDTTVEVMGRIAGLDKNREYAMHIHQFGDCSDPKASGEHFDPYGTGKHASPESPIGTHHSGDLPNIKSDDKGVAVFSFKTKAFTVIPSPYSILGRAVIIHNDKDDYKSQPAGNAGKRIACGIIGVVE